MGNEENIEQSTHKEKESPPISEEDYKKRRNEISEYIFKRWDNVLKRLFDS